MKNNPVYEDSVHAPCHCSCRACLRVYGDFTAGDRSCPAGPHRQTWTGPMLGYDEGTGFTDYPHLTLAMVIEEQHGRLFSGHILFTSNGTEWTTGIAGAIGRDNKTLTPVEQDGGYCSGEVLATDEIELTYMQDGSLQHCSGFS